MPAINYNVILSSQRIWTNGRATEYKTARDLSFEYMWDIIYKNTYLSKLYRCDTQIITM